jgi:U5 small nuclear ribonucleoprotein component
VLHEDKKYYPDAEEVFPEAEVLVQEGMLLTLSLCWSLLTFSLEDTMALSEPVIKPIRMKTHDHRMKVEDFPPTTFSKEYLINLMSCPDLIRNVAVVGQLHHGKTGFMQLLVDQTHENLANVHKNAKFTDTRFDEEERGLSIKSAPMSLVLPDSRGKSYVAHLIDTPGHLNFSDEITAALRLCDGIALVVDVVEGVMLGTERVIHHALQEGLVITVVIAKMDRLVVELKLPPADAFYKLRNVIDGINAVIEDYFQDAEVAEKFRVSPEIGNVIFASGHDSWSFSLTQFATIYLDNSRIGDREQVKPAEFAKRLWGDRYFDKETRRSLGVLCFCSVLAYSCL